MRKLLVVLLGCCLLMSCGSNTHIISSWRDPGVTIDTGKINKYMVAALLKNQATRREVEDQMVAMLPARAIQSYKELGMEELKENDTVLNQRLASDGYDGIVVMRLVNITKETQYVPGSYPMYYNSWRGYYGYSWSGFYDPGYYVTDKQYHVEVNVYSLKRDKLIWTGFTNTINPSGHAELFDEVAKVVFNRMKAEKFIQ